MTLEHWKQIAECLSIMFAVLFIQALVIVNEGRTIIRRSINDHERTKQALKEFGERRSRHVY